MTPIEQWMETEDYAQTRDRFVDVFMKRLSRVSPYRKMFGHKKPGAVPQIYFSGGTIHRYRSQESAYDLQDKPTQKKIVEVILEQRGRSIRGAKLKSLVGCATADSLRKAVSALNKGVKVALKLEESFIIGNSQTGYRLNEKYLLNA